MLEYGIIRIGSNDIENRNYDVILDVLHQLKIEVLKSVSYKETVYNSTSDLSNKEYNYEVLLLKGHNIKNVLTGIKYVFNDKNLEYNKQLYISSKDFFSYDLRKYFDMTPRDLEMINNRDFNNNVEQTLAIIKPDGFTYKNKIHQMLSNNGFQIINEKITVLDEEILKEHYAHLLDKPFYKNLEKYMMSGPVDIMILEGRNAVEKLRNLMGPTDSKKAPVYTIRGMYGTDITCNAIHGSDSKENAQIEIERFFGQKKKTLK